MKLTILGSGTYQPELERHSAAFLVETSNSKICFDFGRGAVDQLLKLGISITQIDALFITHWHLDHVADLMPLLQYTVSPLPDDLSITLPRQKPLIIYGPKGTKARIDSILKIGYEKENYLLIKELGQNEKITGNDWEVTTFSTDHVPDMDCLCYRLKSNDKILAYSGDSIQTEGLKEAIKGADLAIIESSWPKKVDPKSHLTGEQAGKIAQEQGVEKIVLTHLAPYYLKNFDPVSDAKKYFQGEVVLAEDLATMEI